MTLFKFILYTSAFILRVYKKSVLIFSRAGEYTAPSSHLSLFSYSRVFPSQSFVRMESWEAGLHSLHLRRLSECANDQVLGERHHDCSPFVNILFLVTLIMIRSSSSSYLWMPERLYDEFLAFCINCGP